MAITYNACMHAWELCAHMINKYTKVMQGYAEFVVGLQDFRFEDFKISGFRGRFRDFKDFNTSVRDFRLNVVANPSCIS